MSKYHQPVMLQECIEGLDIDPEGIYVDVTFGGGGHSSEILSHLTAGKLYGFDQDPDAKANAAAFQQNNFYFVAANFRYLKRYLRMYQVEKVDGILADLGVSSHQIDAGHRGFSTRFDGSLDMRMSQAGEKSASHVINQYREKELQDMFSRYGEVKNARTLAQRIVASRPIETTTALKSVCEEVAPKKTLMKYLAQVFQAIRIEVNEEIPALEDFLMQSVDVLKPNGRLVVMSYHSLEDRLVKNMIRTGNFEGKPDKDLYGNLLRPLEPLNRKPITASEIELDANPRARSAKLRVAIKNG